MTHPIDKWVPQLNLLVSSLNADYLDLDKLLDVDEKSVTIRDLFISSLQEDQFIKLVLLNCTGRLGLPADKAVKGDDLVLDVAKRIHDFYYNPKYVGDPKHPNYWMTKIERFRKIMNAFLSQ